MPLLHLGGQMRKGKGISWIQRDNGERSERHLRHTIPYPKSDKKTPKKKVKQEGERDTITYETSIGGRNPPLKVQKGRKWFIDVSYIACEKMHWWKGFHEKKIYVSKEVDLLRHSLGKLGKFAYRVDQRKLSLKVTFRGGTTCKSDFKIDSKTVPKSSFFFFRRFQISLWKFFFSYKYYL